MSTPVFPTRHGDWHEIDGQLVDLSQRDTHDPEVVTGSDVDDEPPPISLPPVSPAKRRNKTSSED